MRLFLRTAGGCLGLLLAAACGEDQAAETLCVPGQNVFCRCPSGQASTQPCNKDGQSLGTCGPCDGSDPTGGGETDPPPSHGESPGEGAGSRPFGSACEAAGDCGSATCQFGYCTRTCDKPSDCPFPAAECVTHEGSAVCMATCATKADCASFGGGECNADNAVDHWAVRVCR